MNIRNRGIYLWVILTILASAACQIDESAYNARFKPFTDQFELATGYNLLYPTETFILPGSLMEISGLSWLNDSTLACVQDEAGIIYFFNLNQGSVTERHRFSGSGDYEGIQIVEDQFYILKSNGNIYHHSLTHQTTEDIKTPLDGRNNAEGLGFDSSGNRLLIACKGRAGLEGKRVKGKAVYSYNLSEGFDVNPVFHITPGDLEVWNARQDLPLRLTKRRKAFMPSAIAVHPETTEIYLVANVGKLLIVLEPMGAIKYCVPLSPRIFRQPEGMCFGNNGDLFIANEGQDGSGRIHVFRKKLMN